MSIYHLFNIILLLFICLQISSPTDGAAKCRPQDRSALLAFKNTIVKDPSLSWDCSFVEWDETTDCCSWEGITCRPSTGTVIAFNHQAQYDCTSAILSSNSSLFQLSSLQNLTLGFLNFQRSVIPNEIAKLSQLQTLTLINTNLSGPIPDAVGKLIHLQILSLAGNYLSGTIPAGLFSHPQLSVLHLSGNQLRIPLLSPGAGSSELTALYLDDNMLNGTIPSWLFFLPRLQNLILGSNNFVAIQPFDKPANSSLTYLDLSFNNITGPFPYSLLQLVTLNSLNLNNNQLADAVEWNSLKNMANLSTLDLSSNKGLSLKHTVGSPAKLPLLRSIAMVSCGFTEFPEFLSELEGLEELELSGNKISGACFQQSGWVRLVYFFGDGNQITAFKFPNTIISTFDLGHNLIGGKLPELPASLDYLSMEDNQLSGNLPELPASLEVLFLENNQLSGRISSLNMLSLHSLNLSYNNFEGPIPPNSFLNDSFFGNPRLCGPPLTKSC